MDNIRLSIADFERIHPLRKKQKLDHADDKDELPPVLLCIDIEAFEHDHGKITEIGLAAIDVGAVSEDRTAALTLDEWYSKIQHLHIRISEHRHLVNKHFVKGHPDKFQFGESVFVPKAQVGAVLKRAFANPSKLNEAIHLDRPLIPSTSEVTLVGHSLSSDLAFERSLQFEFPKDLRKIDTQVVPGSTKKSRPSLAKLLIALNIKYSHLHNAGNDAAYTLRALLATTAKETEAPGALGKGLAQAARELVEARVRSRQEKAAAPGANKQGTQDTS